MKRLIPRRFVLAGLLFGGLALALVACSDGLFPGEERAHFEPSGDSLVMTGTIVSRTPRDLATALAGNPGLREIVMLEVPGSTDDDANLRAARMVRRAGLATRLLATSEIASGGVDFFLAGVERRIAPGAQLGVHSWAEFSGLEGRDLPRTDPLHRLYLNYYREMGIDPEFYWFTLRAASAQDIHWMTPAEIRRYRMATR